ncbi:MAG: hypothetical protein WDN47_00880 [Candidatus Doudnabacteria bacterium]
MPISFESEAPHEESYLRKDLDTAAESPPVDAHNEFEAADKAEQDKFKSWEAMVREAGITEQDAASEQLWEFYRDGSIKGNAQATERLKEISKQQDREKVINGQMTEAEFKDKYRD